MAEAAAGCVKKALNDCGIHSGELQLTPAATAAVLSPAVRPDRDDGDGASVVRSPLFLEFVGKEDGIKVEADIRDSPSQASTFDVSIHVFRIMDGEIRVYNYKEKEWIPVGLLQKKHGLVLSMEAEAGREFTQEEADRALLEHKKLIELKELFPEPGLMKYSAYRIRKDGEAQEIRACLIPSNPECTGVVVLVDDAMGGQLSLCQKYMGQELECFCRRAAGEEALGFLDGFHNEWVSVAFTERAEDLVPVLTGMLDHYTADSPVCVFPLSMEHYANVTVTLEGDLDTSLSTDGDMLTETETGFVEKIWEKLQI